MEALIVYILSTPIKAILTEQRLAHLRAIIEQHLAHDGMIRIVGRAGIFEAYN